ncbi:response regulator transcription factor [Algiphilus sp.]|uniref:helix-turn-helix transcriptional regulator n=1 Tax=Algiphilus sp. TaxID=1872431 RepID=UPI003B51BCA2
MDPVQRLISRLYRTGVERPAEGFQHWALQQLKAVVPHDAAVWGMGHAGRARFHNVKVIGVDAGYSRALERWVEHNPIYPRLAASEGVPVDMRDVLDDDTFYRSKLYRKCFRPYGIERILSSGHMDPRCGLYTLLSLYRFDRSHPFSDTDRERFRTVAFHLVHACSHNYFLHIARPASEQSHRPAAVVDAEGVLHEAEPDFIALLAKHFPDWEGMHLPELIAREIGRGGQFSVEALRVSVEPLSDIHLLRIWEETPLDRLTTREREVVEAVSRGLSHKEAGRELGLAPTTVSSHLYRAYAKLEVSSRSALARLVHGTH